MKTFEEFDRLNLSTFADSLTSFMETERHFVEGALLISLNGSFGCGKSTFFEMWRERLLKADPQAFSVITLNAWEADYERDPLLSIVRGFVQHFEAEGENVDTDDLKTTAGKLGKFALSVGNDIVTKVTGVDIQKAGEKAEPENPNLLGKACYEAFNERQEVFTHLKEILSSAIEESDHPIIVIIDELDRCRPDHAVEYLETIKHIFDLEGLVFVLGVDKRSLASSVRSLFGESLNFDEYYRKFVHRNISIPTPDESALKSFSAELISQYLQSEALTGKGRYSFAKWENHRIDNFVDLFSDFGLSPRQIHEVFRLVAHALSCSEEQKERMLWGWQIGAMVMATLSVSETSLYHKIGRGVASVDELTNVLKTKTRIVSSERHGLWWTTLIYFGAFQRDESLITEFQQALKDFGIWDEEMTEDGLKQKIGEMAQAYHQFGYGSEAPYHEIYNRLENVRQFGKD